MINAAAALMAAGKVDNFDGGIEQAKLAIDSGGAMAKLDALVEFTTANTQP